MEAIGPLVARYVDRIWEMFAISDHGDGVLCRPGLPLEQIITSNGYVPLAQFSHIKLISDWYYS